MERHQLLVVLAAAALVLLAHATVAPASSPEAAAGVRFIHASPDAPSVDVTLGSTEVFTDVAFGDVADYLAATSGTYTVALRSHIDGTPLVTETLVFTSSDYTLAAAGTLATLDLVRFLDDNSAPAPGNARGRLVHLSPGGPAVDVAIKHDGILFSDVGYKEASDYAEVPADTYELDILLAGTTIPLGSTSLTVDPNTVSSAFAIGYPTSLQFVQTVDKSYGPPCEPVDVLSLTADSPMELGEAMTFTATVSGTPPFGYAWDFNTDGVFEIVPTPATLSPHPIDVVTYTYGSVGPFTATVMVANCSVTEPYTDVRSVLVSVEALPANTPPSISGLPDQAVPKNGTADNAIDLWAYAGDAEDDDDALTFTITNTPAPEAGVTIDADRYVDISPTADWTGATDVEIQVEDTGGLSDTDSLRVIVGGHAVCLPLVVKRYPPLPEIPVLNPIEEFDDHGNYRVSWETAEFAETYLLQEDDDPAFPDPTAAYSGTQTWWDATGRAPGTYHYRVKASNAWGDSGWSGVQPVTVSPPVYHYQGDSPPVSFDVEGQEVCNFEMEVTFQPFTCTVTLPTCMEIVDGAFSYTALDPWFEHYENGITGTFETEDRVAGAYSIHFCGSTLAVEPSEGEWEAMSVATR